MPLRHLVPHYYIPRALHPTSHGDCKCYSATPDSALSIFDAQPASPSCLVRQLRPTSFQHPAAPASEDLHSKHVPALLIAALHLHLHLHLHLILYLHHHHLFVSIHQLLFLCTVYNLSTHPTRHHTNDTHKPSIVSFILPSPTLGSSLSQTYLPTFLPLPILSLF